MRKLIKTLGNFLLSLAIACVFGYGFYGLVTYALPLSHNDYRQAMTSYVADPSEVLLNGAQQDYENGRVAEATKVLELNLEKMVDQNGRYRVQDRWKLERIYFLLGKCYQKQKKLDKAAENYIETLRINPKNLPAKYNLEMVQPPPPPPGGGGDGDEKPNGQIPPKI